MSLESPSPPPGPAGGKGTQQLLVPALCAVILGATALFSGMKLNHDAALLLQCGRLILMGSVPYTGHVETNPHMAQYIHVPPVLTADFLGVPVVKVFHGGVLLISLCTAWLVRRSLRRWKRPLPETGVLLVSASVLMVSLMALMHGDFGQREHLFFLALAAYLIIRIGRAEGAHIPGPSAVITGLFTGVMMVCKPVFLLQVIALEAWLLLRYGRMKPFLPREAAAAGLVAVLLGVHLILLPGSLGSPFFTRWIPLITGGYRAYDLTIPGMIRGNLRQWPVILAGFGLAATAWLRAARIRRRLVETLAFTGVTALLFFFAQHKGWLYQLLPATGMAILLGAAALAVLLEKIRPGSPDRALKALLVTAMLTLAVRSFHLNRSRYDNMEVFLSLIEEHSEPGERICFISTSVYPKYPTLVYADRLPGTRFMSAFPVALLYGGHGVPDPASPGGFRLPDPWLEEERLFLSELGEDILTNRPALVFIRGGEDCQGCPPGFSLSGYLDASLWIDRYMEDYRFLVFTEGFRVYRRI